ncbi:hypothetical protein [Xylella fastidiosa]
MGSPWVLSQKTDIDAVLLQLRSEGYLGAVRGPIVAVVSCDLSTVATKNPAIKKKGKYEEGNRQRGSDDDLAGRMRQKDRRE